MDFHFCEREFHRVCSSQPGPGLEWRRDVTCTRIIEFLAFRAAKRRRFSVAGPSSPEEGRSYLGFVFSSVRPSPMGCEFENIASLPSRSHNRLKSVAETSLPSFDSLIPVECWLPREKEFFLLGPESLDFGSERTSAISY